MKQLDAEAVKAAVTIEQIVGQRVVLKRAGSGDLAGLCPFHKERTPSFTVTPATGLYHCFGCGASGDAFSFVQQAEGVSFSEAVSRVAEIAGVQIHDGVAPIKVDRPKQEITATYPYMDESGQLLYEVCRLEPGKNGRKKDFLQRRRHPVDGAWVWGLNEGYYRKGRNGEWYPAKGESDPDDDELPAMRRVLYNLPDVLDATTVYITEGEKDANTLTAWGFVATTNSGGSSKGWHPEQVYILSGKAVVILPDLDAPGLKRAQVLASQLDGIAKWVITVKVPAGKDVTEFAQSGRTADEFVALVEATRHDVITRSLEERGLLSPEEIIEHHDGGVHAFLDPSQRTPGLATGFSRLDSMTVGLRPGELFIIAGRPAMGKTALAMNIGEYVASRDSPVAVFSLEMSREQLLTRMVCSRARVDQNLYKAGDLDRDERLAVQRALNEIWRMPLGIDDHPLADLQSLRRKLISFRERAGGLALVIVDYIQLMTASRRRGGDDNRSQEVGALSRGLKLLAKEMGVPIIALSQLSRATETRAGDHRPQMSDLRDSGSLEQDADMVAFVFREEYYKPQDHSLRGKAELILAKQRNGPIGHVKLTFLHHCTRFENYIAEEKANDYQG